MMCCFIKNLKGMMIKNFKKILKNLWGFWKMGFLERIRSFGFLEEFLVKVIYDEFLIYVRNRVLSSNFDVVGNFDFLKELIK